MLLDQTGLFSMKKTERYVVWSDLLIRIDFFLLQVVAGVIGSCHAQASLIKGLLESRSRGLGSKEPWQGSCIKGRICSSLTVTVLDSKSRGLGLAPGWINMLCSWEKTVIHCVIHQVTGLLQTNVMTRAQLFEG